MAQAGTIGASVDGNKVVIEIDMDAKGRPSSSGKTTVHATTGGPIALPNGMKLNLTIYNK